MIKKRISEAVLLIMLTIAIVTMWTSFQNPEMTRTQFVIEYWETYLVLICMAVLYSFIVPRPK